MECSDGGGWIKGGNLCLEVYGYYATPERDGTGIVLLKGEQLRSICS
jgi:hypothetical protein